MNPLLRTVGVLSLLSGLASAQVAPAEVEARARSTEAALAKLGFAFAAPTKLALLAPGEYSSACESRLSALYRPGWFEAQHYLRQALGIDPGAGPAALKARLARDQFGWSPALYLPEQRAVALDSSRAKPGPELDAALARALTLAWRDAATNLDALLGKGAAPTDEVLVGWSIASGEAELAALQLREQRDVLTLDPTALGEAPGAKLADAWTRLACTGGRDLQFGRLQIAGWDAVRALAGEAPTSTEQVLHPVKLYRDTPKNVALPEWGPELGIETIVHDDVLGELAANALLLEAGVEPAAARLASVGWDGDRLQLLRTKGGALALVWRVLFDRPEDVQQFAAVFTPKALGKAIVRGYAFDFVRSDSVPLLQQLIAALNAAKPGPTPNPEDQESTAAVEAAVGNVLDLRPRLAGGMWLHPAYELAIPAPERWTQELLGGKSYLMGLQVEDFRDNVAVVALPRQPGASIAELLARNVANVTKKHGMTIETSETRLLCGREVAYVRYSGELGSQKLHVTTLIYLHDERPIVITASCADRSWASAQPLVDAMFAGIAIGRPRSK